jgi:deoxyribonuclease-4
MLHIGCHLSNAKGFEAMGKTALSIGADTFQFFTRNPRGSQAKDIDPQDAKLLCELMATHHFAPIIAHAPYTLNPASADNKTRDFALQTFADDLKRMEYVPGNLYNFHPGSYTTLDKDYAIKLIIDLLNDVIKEDQKTIILLETMSGKGSEIGRNFNELKQIIDGVKYKDKIGVCMDTCHMYSAGYDVKNNFDKVLDEFDEIIGLNYLYAIHLNDSKMPFNSNKDRHEKLGLGSIGIDGIKNIVLNDRIKDIPLYLETPNELDGYMEEIKLIKNLRGE